MSLENLKKIVFNPPKKESSTTNKKKTKKATVFDDNDVSDQENNIEKSDRKKEEDSLLDLNNSNTITKKKKKKKKKKEDTIKSSLNNMNIKPFNIDEDEDEKEDKSPFNKKKSKSQVLYEDIDENEEYDNNTVVIKKTKKKKKKKPSNNKENEENTDENLDEDKPKKKKKKKKKNSNDNNDEEENQKEDNESNNIIEEEAPKKKKKIKKKSDYNNDEDLNQKEDNNINNIEEEVPKTKKKIKKKSDDNNVEKKKQNEDFEHDNINEDEENQKIRKKSGKNNKQKGRKSGKKDKTKENDIQTSISEKDKDENKDNFKYNIFNIPLSNSLFMKTKKKLGKIFFTKKKKNKNQDYIETETISTESTIQKEKNVSKFLEKAKDIKYKGYEYKIKEEDYFKRKNKIIKTILNSEDAAIKLCEDLSNQIADGGKWTDQDFGENKNRESLYGDGGAPPGFPREQNIKWYPLSEISDYAQFFSDGVESNDVIQGCLGDCWFISALSVLATKDYLLRGEFSDEILADKKIDEEENVMLSTGVYPPIFHSFRKKGIFCFRFFKDFQWRYVLVDSFLPCNRVYENQTPTLLFGQCRARNEFWVPLIEKAYAKLHGSYQSIVSGFIDDGLVDLTGLTSKKMLIEVEKLNTRQKIDELWDVLESNSTLNFKETNQRTAEGKLVSAKFYIRNKTMMGCSVDTKGNNVEMEVIVNNRHTGILARHAYSILDVFQISKARGKKRSRLLRIRNPWGRKEWNGKWSDDSVETKQNKEKIEQKLNEKYKATNEKINLSQEDGTFLMCFSDFRQIFNKLYICKNFPPSFIGVRIYGQWTKNESGGLPINPKQEKTFYTNPQFYLAKKIDGLVSISLLQKDGRLIETNFPFTGAINKVCLLIFRVTSNRRIRDLNNLLDKTLIVNRRDLLLELNLPKGEYIIIPSIFESGKIGDYCLELHFEDELIQNNKINGKNLIDCLKYTTIEKLEGESVNWEIISEFISSKAASSSANKEKFIIQKFKEIIKEEDDFEYSNSNNKRKGMFNENYDDEDLDYI